MYREIAKTLYCQNRQMQAALHQEAKALFAMRMIALSGWTVALVALWWLK